MSRYKPSNRDKSKKWWKRELADILRTAEEKYRDHPRYYLGYGSNLNVLQMQQRCPTSMPVMACNLLNYRLVFSDVATVVPCEGESVPSSIWKVEPADIEALDRYEGYPTLYEKKYATIPIDGETKTVFFYYLTWDAEPSTPCASYYRTCLEGYVEWGLPVETLRIAEAEAEDYERDHEHTPHECAFCREVFPASKLNTTRHYGWLCDACYGIMFYQEDDVKILPDGTPDVWTQEYYDEMTGTYGDNYFNPTELDWDGNPPYVDDGKYISQYRHYA